MNYKIFALALLILTLIGGLGYGVIWLCDWFDSKVPFYIAFGVISLANTFCLFVACSEYIEEEQQKC